MLLCVRVGVVDSIVVDGTSLCDGDDAGARPAHKPQASFPTGRCRHHPAAHHQSPTEGRAEDMCGCLKGLPGGK